MRTFDFPTLRHLLGAYLNQDWPDDYGSIEAAIDAYRQEADPPRRARAVVEIDALLAAGLDDAALAEFSNELGLAYELGDEPGAARDFLTTLRARIAP